MSNFLVDYLAYAATDEAPQEFHMLSAYSTLSGAIGRRVWMTHGEVNIYPNIYSLLIGVAGCGKDTAINKCISMLSDLGNVTITADVETVEGMLRFIGGDPDANPPKVSPTEKIRIWPDGVSRETHEIVIVATEFIDFIRVNPTGWTGLLNSIYSKDVRYSYHTKNCKDDNIIGPYVVLVGGIPTDVSKQLQEIGVISTGLARRTLLQYGERKYHEPRPFPLFTDVERAARTRCLDHLKKIQTYSGALKFSPEAIQWWTNWYTEHSKTLLARCTPATQGWLSSKPTQVQKLAMLNSLAVRDDLLITPDELEVALAVISDVESGFLMVFSGIGRNENSGVATRILEQLKHSPTPIGYKKLFGNYYNQFTAGRGAAELLEVMQYLVSTGEVITAFLGNPPEQHWEYKKPTQPT